MKNLLYILLLLSCLMACKPEQAIQQPTGKAEVMFREPIPYVQQFIRNDSLQLDSIRHHSFEIYFKSSSYTADNLDRIKTELDTAYARILSVLDLESYPHGIYLIAVDSEDEMEQLMGHHIKGGAAPGADLVFFVFNEKIRPQFKHELFHLIAYETWGPTDSRLLNEGGATYTDNTCYYNNPMYSINAYLLQQGKLFTLQELIHNFDNKARENDVIAYIQSAGYFKFLYENYGAEKMQKLWKEGFDAFEEIYGLSLEEFDEKWKAEIRNVSIPLNFDEEMLMEQGCG